MVAQGQHPGLNQPEFWDELLLLKVNANFLTLCITHTSEEDLLKLKVGPD